ncbi:MAG: Fe-S cluster assembly sulfur transfer protein SufU [Oligoflexales bacterium]
MSQELYQQIILEHNKKPRNFGKMENATYISEGFNPLCGDHFWIYLKMDGNKIADVSFEGSGCAISKASASMMTMQLKDQTIEHAEDIIKNFQGLVKGELSAADAKEKLGRLSIFSNIWQYPSRVKCAVLAWHAASGAFQNKKTVSTE